VICNLLGLLGQSPMECADLLGGRAQRPTAKAPAAVKPVPSAPVLQDDLTLGGILEAGR
jgi:hypothetical protein